MLSGTMPRVYSRGFRKQVEHLVGAQKTRNNRNDVLLLQTIVPLPAAAPLFHVPDKCPIFITQRMIDGGDPNANASGISSKVLDLALTQSVSQQEMAVPKPMSIATR